MVYSNKYPVEASPKTDYSNSNEIYKTCFGNHTYNSKSLASERKDGDRPSLIELATDLFLIGFRITENFDTGKPDSLKKLLENYIRYYEHRCFTERYSHGAIASSLFALTAWLDECVLNRGGELKEEWIKEPLVVHYYNDARAGETFFSKLDSLLEAPDTNKETLTIYYLCMKFGFEGRYKLSEKNMCAEHMSEIWDKTQASKGYVNPIFSISLEGRFEKPSSRAQITPWLLGSLGLLFFALALYITLVFKIAAEQNEARDRWEQVNEIFYKKEL